MFDLLHLCNIKVHIIDLTSQLLISQLPYLRIYSVYSTLKCRYYFKSSKFVIPQSPYFQQILLACTTTTPARMA